MTKDNIIAVIAGKEDKQLKAESLKEHCLSNNLPLKQFDNVGHRLETKDMNLNMDILNK
jgi:hypothetical protein